jgi:hypothetical protein
MFDPGAISSLDSAWPENAQKIVLRLAGAVAARSSFLLDSPLSFNLLYAQLAD